MKIVSLIENKAPNSLLCEHGLSVYIEYRGKHYLLDTGASNQFIKNANTLGVDVSKVDVSVLSHAHYDHSGGYQGFFSLNSQAKVYLQSAAKEGCYVKIGFFKKYIGIPKGVLENNKNRFVFIDKDFQIDEGVWLICHKIAGLEAKGKKAHMYVQSASGLHSDDFQHEHSLVFDSRDGLIILNSCCHGGVDNIICEVKSAFPNKEVLMMIGGFHLMGARGTKSMGLKAIEVKNLGQRLANLGVKHIYTGHCTGDPAYSILKDTLGDTLQYFSTGTIIKL